MTVISPPGASSYSQPTGIDAYGNIYGTFQLPNGGAVHSFSWTNGVMTDLGDLGPDQYGRAQSTSAVTFDNLGDLVGVAGDPYFFYNDPVLWQGSTIYNLSALVPAAPGQTILAPAAISAAFGFIAANGYIHGQRHGMLLAPVSGFDITKPVTNPVVTGPGTVPGWYTGPVTLTFSATDPDGPQDVAATYFTLDGGGQQTFTAGVPISDGGLHTVQYWSVDQAGNIEDKKTGTFRIDTSFPSTTSSLSGTLGNGGWYTSPVTVRLTPADADGSDNVAATYYIIDHGPRQTIPLDGAFNVTGDGLHTVGFYSVDAAGNTESAHTIGFKIDTTPPHSIATVLVNSNNTATVSITATDSGSGVAATYYILDGGVFQPYIAPFTVFGSGVHTIEYWSADIAGNVESNHEFVNVAIAFATPVVSSISPTVVTAGAAGFTLTVSGSKFAPGAVVLWNGTALTTTFVSASKTTAFISSGLFRQAGTVAIQILNPYPSTVSNIKLLTVNPTPPAITTISPSTLFAGAGTFTLTVTGSAFIPGSTVLWNGAAIPAVFGSETSLTATVDGSLIALPGTATVVVQNPGNPKLSYSKIFTIKAPALSLILLSSNKIKGGVPVNGQVQLNANAVTAVTVTLSSNGVGAFNPASVTIPVGQSTGSFTYTGPVVTTNTLVTLKATQGTVVKTQTITVTK